MQQRPRRPLVLAARATVLLAMAAGSVGYSLADKAVTISVDGQVRTVHTFAGSIESALHRAGIALGTHDVVTPALSTSLHDGSQIVVDRGRPLQLTLDGSPSTVWVTQSELDEAVAAQGLQLDDAYLSASPAQTIPATGLAVTVRLPQQVSLDVAGVTTTVTTTAATVADLFTASGVQLGPDDLVSVPLDHYPVTGDTVTVTRVTETQWLQRDRVAIPTLRVADAALRVGRTQLAHDGRAGTRYRVWEIVRDNGQVVSKTLLSDTTSPVKDKVIRYGTRPKPVVLQAETTAPSSVVHTATVHTAVLHTAVLHTATKPTVKPTAKPTARPKVASLHWAALARCESGGNPREVDGRYYGLYQFTLGTWESVGGHGKPSNATSAEQTYRAELLYEQQGRSPWPACGRLL